MPDRPGALDTDTALRALLQALPHVAVGLKRPGVPPALQPLFSRLGPRHIPALSYVQLDGPMTVGALAERLGLAMPTTSLMVRDLEAAGLVDRTEDPGDRRRRLVGVRDEHRENIQSWLDMRAQPIRAALNRLAPDQRATLVHGLRLLAEEFSRDSGGLDGLTGPYGRRGGTMSEESAQSKRLRRENAPRDAPS